MSEGLIHDHKLTELVVPSELPNPLLYVLGCLWERHPETHHTSESYLVGCRVRKGQDGIIAHERPRDVEARLLRGQSV